jgi:hypothetical protein
MKLLVILFLALPMLAQLRFLPAKKLWVMETDRTSYVLGINEQNSLQNVYWSKKLLRDDDLAPAHTCPSTLTSSPGQSWHLRMPRSPRHRSGRWRCPPLVIIPQTAFWEPERACPSSATLAVTTSMAYRGTFTWRNHDHIPTAFPGDRRRYRRHSRQRRAVH